MSGYELERLLKGLDAHELDRLGQHWNGAVDTELDLVAGLRKAMVDRDRLRERWTVLPAAARDILSFVLRRDDSCLPVRRVIEGSPSSGRTECEVETEIERLEHDGLLFRIEDRNIERFEAPALAVAREVAAVLRDLDGTARTPIGDADPGPFTLKDVLDRRYGRVEGSAADHDRASQHARQAYKLFLMPAAVLKRIKRLPPDVRALVEVAITRFGGLLPRSLWLKTNNEAGPFDRSDLGEVLEEALLGRVADLDLRAYGIEVAEETVVVYQEVCLVYLRARAAEARPQPPVERVAGVDLATNVMRFLRYVDEKGVRYTVQGEIFKATRKRMMTQLVVPRDEDVEVVFRFIYGFALRRRLVERTGERTLRLSEAGRAFEAKDLPEKLKDLLAYAIDDPGCGGDVFHQVRLRRILLRLLRRLDAETWYDAMYVPFLARNSYLAQTPSQGAAAYYADRRERGQVAVTTDLQKLSWHLFHWVRKRLHLLGIVDLGFADGHPIALRLSRLGASLLGGPAQAAEGARSTLVVNPDFEILLFPEADAYQLVHTLDRFSRRLASDRLFRFEISEQSVRSALADGMGIGEILETLADRCRTPLPQNVLFSLTDWGDRAGALILDESGVIHAHRPEVLARLLAHERIRNLTDGDDVVKLRDGVRADDFEVLLRDLGFFLEQRQAADIDERLAKDGFGGTEASA